LIVVGVLGYCIKNTRVTREGLIYLTMRAYLKDSHIELVRPVLPEYLRDAM